MHGRDRMVAHDRMAVDAVGFALIGRKEIAESGVTLELRRTDNQRHIGLIKDRFADFNSLTDIADMWCGIECRADFVMRNRSIQAFKPVERWREIFLHPFRRFAAAGACKTDSLAV